MSRWLARLIVATRIIAPPVIKFIVYCLKLAAISFVAMWKGFPETVDTMADEWVDKAIGANFPSRYSRQLKTVLKVTACLLVVAGWIILSHITVWSFWRIF